MKKVINLILILVIAFSVAGCGGNNKTPDNQNNKQQTKTANTQNPKVNVEKLDAAMKKNPPKIAGPYLQRGRYRMQNNDFNGAIEDFNAALQYEPNNKAAKTMLKRAENMLKRPKDF